MSPTCPGTHHTDSKVLQRMGARDEAEETCRAPNKYLDEKSSSWHAICSKSTPRKTTYNL